MCSEPVCTRCGSSNWILTDRTDWASMMCLNCGDTIDLELYAELIVA